MRMRMTITYGAWMYRTVHNGRCGVGSSEDAAYNDAISKYQRYGRGSYTLEALDACIQREIEKGITDA